MQIWKYQMKQTNSYIQLTLLWLAQFLCNSALEIEINHKYRLDCMSDSLDSLSYVAVWKPTQQYFLYKVAVLSDSLPYVTSDLIFHPN